MKRAFDACIFDLDGTLLNSLEDLADAANYALAQQGLPTHPRDAYRYFVGNGTRILMRRAAPEGTGEREQERLLADMHARYAVNWAYKTRPYEGILLMLKGLAAMGLPLAVLSNKPHTFTLLCIEHFFPDIAFARVQGCPEGGRPKPDPGLALDIARYLELEPSRILFLGDTDVDIKTALAAGMIPAGALWGFRTEDELKEYGAKILLRTPGDLLSLILEGVPQ